MNITEFAIGNYVLLNREPYRVRGIQEDAINPGEGILLLGVGKLPEWYTLNEIEPIEIRRDILELCGFYFKGIDKSKAHYIGHGYSLSTNYFDCIRSIGAAYVTIDNLHHLANFFFLYTGIAFNIDYDKLKAAI